jgi:hypothetical protein
VSNGAAALRGSPYFPPPSADPTASDAQHRLAGALRTLIEMSVTVDAGASGSVALDQLTASLGEVADRLGVLPRLESIGHQPLSEVGPSVGLSNPVAPPLHLSREGSITRGWATFGPAYQGGPGDLHGGVMLAVFDDVLGCAQMVGDVVGRTGTLTVRFRAATPIGSRIDYEGRLDRVEGRKVFCSGEARCEGVLLAEAEAIFVAAPARSAWPEEVLGDNFRSNKGGVETLHHGDGPLVGSNEMNPEV